jgi:ATP-binding cassette subfamily B protein
MDEQPDLSFPMHSAQLPRSFAIGCMHVSFRYVPGRPILEDVTFRLEEGMHVGIVGPIGSGKSILVYLLARLYDPDSGAITIGNVPLQMLSMEDLRNLVRVVPQEPFLFSMTIADNIRVGNPNASDAEVLRALERAGIAEEVLRFPQQLHTVVGERGILLSGGQRQRLAIARALVGQPRILLLDDALSAVDTATERHIQAELRALHCTTIIVSHRISTIEHCDWVMVLENGRITAQGTHAEVLATSSFYRTLYDRQQLERRLNVELPNA